MNNSKDGQINYVELPAADLAATQQFFESVFGWDFTAWGPDYLSFKDGALDGGFYRAESRARVADGSALIVLYHSDLESVLARVKEAGAEIEKEIFSFPGGRRFHFLEPSGNEFAVWSEH